VDALSFAGCNDLDVAALDGAPSTIHGLNISSRVIATPRVWMTRVAALFPDLRELDVTDWYTDGEGDDWVDVDDDEDPALDVSPLARGCLRLEVLRASYSEGVTGLTDLARECRRLRVIYLEQAHLEGAVPLLSRLGGLRQLSLVCCEGFGEQDLLDVARAGTLRSLYIEPDTGMGDVVSRCDRLLLCRHCPCGVLHCAVLSSCGSCGGR
jgi:hypothetical protein